MASAAEPDVAAPAESRVAALLACRAGVPSARAGDRLAVHVDRVLLDGPSAAVVLSAFETRRGPRRPRDRRAARDDRAAHAPPEERESAADTMVEPERFVAVAGPEQSRAEQRRVATFAAAHGWAIGLQPALAGLPSVVAVDEGLIGSGDVVAGPRSDTGSLGGLGCAALRGEPLELAGLMSESRLAVVVPATRFVRVTGRLPRWVGAFDLALAVLEAAGGAAALRGSVLELHGDTLAQMEVAERLALCGALAAAGASSLVAPDERTAAFLAARRSRPDTSLRAAAPAPPPEGGWLAVDARRVGLAALQLGAPSAASESPVPAGPSGGPGPAGSPAAGPLPGRRLDPTAGSSPGKAGRSQLRDSPPPAVDEVFLGGRIEDLRVAAEVLRDRNVRRGLFLGIQPASQRVLLHAIEEGLAADFLRAGASLLPPGAGPPAPARGEQRIVTSPSGPGDILVGPAVAAASAVAGRLADPEGMRRSHRRSSRLG